MIYKVDSSKSKVEFLALAPLHKFKGWVEEGFEGEIDIDFDENIIKDIEVIVKTEFFDTGDRFKNREMHKYIQKKKIPQASFTLEDFESMNDLGSNKYDVSLSGILKFMDIERDLVLNIKATKSENRLIADLNFEWSFKNYGLKPPQILFIKVKDIVKISAHVEFELEK